MGRNVLFEYTLESDEIDEILLNHHIPMTSRV